MRFQRIRFIGVVVIYVLGFFVLGVKWAHELSWRAFGLWTIWFTTTATIAILARIGATHLTVYWRKRKIG